MPNDDMSHQATEESFWSLLEKGFSIYIPRIQRDYAQGREDAPTTLIRNNFLDDLFRAIAENKELDVNFIYGNIEMSESTDKKKFIPIDGQQRLTTLFLLYWYFAEYSGAIKDAAVVRRLLQFQYETRHVTGQFCEHLVRDVRIDIKKAIMDGHSMSLLIKDYYWFFSDFENDATVKSMIVMIDAINQKAAEYEENVLDQFWSRMQGNCPIRFLYQNLDDVGLTDGIYIKMNARGKTLTHFENFKAQLNDFLSSDEQFSKDFMNQINGEWSQFFWTPEYRREKPDKTGKEITFDSQMMKFFRFIMWCDYMKSINDEDAEAVQNIRDALRVLSNEPDYIFTARLFKDGFKDVGAIHAKQGVVGIETFKAIYKLLNILAKRKRDTDSITFADTIEYQKCYLNEENSFLRLIGATDERALSNEDQILMFAEYAFLVKYSSEDGSFDKGTELNRWLRIWSNLIHATINVQMDVTYRAIRSIQQVLDTGMADHINEYMAALIKRNYRQGPMFSFFEDQVNEESIKAILMMKSHKWKETIVEAEKSFLGGQTGSLVDFSGIYAIYQSEISDFEEKNPDAEKILDLTCVLAGCDDNSEQYKKFRAYLDKFILIFDENGLRKELEEKSIFRRALLCFGGGASYMLPAGKPIQSFLDNTDRDCSFRRLLRDENAGKRILLKELFDRIDAGQELVPQLEEIIAGMQYNENSRWKKYFIEMPEILSSMYRNSAYYWHKDGWIFETTQRFISRRGNDRILLLTKTQTNSRNRELYSYVLYLKALEKELKVSYHVDITDGSEKYLYYTNRQGEEVQVLYQNFSDPADYQFYARTEAGNGSIYNGDLDQMIDYIEKTVQRD